MKSNYFISGNVKIFLSSVFIWTFLKYSTGHPLLKIPWLIILIYIYTNIKRTGVPTIYHAHCISEEQSYVSWHFKAHCSRLTWTGSLFFLISVGADSSVITLTVLLCLTLAGTKYFIAYPNDKMFICRILG